MHVPCGGVRRMGAWEAGDEPGHPESFCATPLAAFDLLKSGGFTFVVRQNQAIFSKLKGRFACR